MILPHYHTTMTPVHDANDRGVMVRRLTHTPDLLQCYRETIGDHEKRGFIEKADNVNVYGSAKRAHFNPHHEVDERLCSHAPIRVVFDCSHRPSSRSLSLND